MTQQVKDQNRLRVPEDRIFAQAQALLQASGVSHVHMKKCWAAHDVANAVLKELDNESYTVVVMGGHLHNRLAQIFAHSSVDVVCQQAHDVIVWLSEVDRKGDKMKHQLYLSGI